jgi:ABC-type transport system involved in cytochrome bd biosynthesis fused ATPase/permease subunit
MDNTKPSPLVAGIVLAVLGLLAVIGLLALTGLLA